VRWSRPIFVPRETDSAAAESYHAEMQAALERVRDEANTLVGPAV